MNINENDKSKGICHTCETIVNTTFKYRDIGFVGKSETVNILVSVCDNCDCIISTLAQSTSAIKLAREQFKN